LLLRVRRAAARLLLTAGRAAINRYHLAAGPTAANPQQRRAAAGTDARHLHAPCSAYYAGNANEYDVTTSLRLCQPPTGQTENILYLRNIRYQQA